MDLSKLQNHAYLLYRTSIIIHSPHCFPPHLGQVLHLESQTTSFTQKMVQVGRDYWRSSCPDFLLTHRVPWSMLLRIECRQLQISPGEETLQPLWAADPVSSYLHSKNVLHVQVELAVPVSAH